MGGQETPWDDITVDEFGEIPTVDDIERRRREQQEPKQPD